MQKIFFLFLFQTGLLFPLNAQASFPEKCKSVWEGMMHLYKQGTIQDSVHVRLTVARTSDPAAWTWKTEYLSAKNPVVKDYTLRAEDPDDHMYILDEGGGIELKAYLFGNKLYSVFETEGVLLTSTYQLKGDELIFEVTSGKKIPAGKGVVSSFTIRNLQRIAFKKVK